MVPVVVWDINTAAGTLAGESIISPVVQRSEVRTDPELDRAHIQLVSLSSEWLVFVEWISVFV